MKLFLTLFAAAFALVVLYGAITADLCSRIDTFDPAQQEEMKLDATVCSAPIWKRF